MRGLRAGVNYGKAVGPVYVRDTVVKGYKEFMEDGKVYRYAIVMLHLPPELRGKKVRIVVVPFEVDDRGGGRSAEDKGTG